MLIIKKGEFCLKKEKSQGSDLPGFRKSKSFQRGSWRKGTDSQDGEATGIYWLQDPFFG